jgi:predicted RNA binding protein YcfA (HicA-like mRNA interferase family)
MPRKIRQLIKDLEKVGFVSRGGKGSHRNFIHKNCPYPVVISGKLSDDAKHYQEKALKLALKELK